jgi:hypothetical protein
MPLSATTGIVVGTIALNFKLLLKSTSKVFEIPIINADDFSTGL